MMIILLLLLSYVFNTYSLILFGSQGSRSPLVNWYLHELDIPFTMGNRIENPHPFGQIPCLKDESTIVFESGAILMYLADKYDKELNTPEKRSAVNTWLVWANSSLDPILFKENERGQVIGTGAGVENKKLRILDSILSKSKYLLGDNKFSVADVAVASYLLYIPQFFGRSINFSRYPAIASYMLTCCKRPAYRKAYPTETDQIVEICESFQ